MPKVLPVKNPGDVLNDAGGMGIMQKLGENMTWVLKKLQ
jgi:hypothetical protein